MSEQQQVIIEFISDTTGLQPAEDRLAALGKIDQQTALVFKQTNEELKKRVGTLKDISAGAGQAVISATKEQQVYNKLVSSLKTLSGQAKTTVQDLLKLNPKEVAGGFENASIAVDDFINTLENTTGATATLASETVSLKKQLFDLMNQMGQLKLAGQSDSQEFIAMAEKAGQLKQAIVNTGKEVKNFSSNTKTLDNVLGSIQALASGFVAVQGAAALFGDDNKELQQTLVKVTASMAVLQGVQGLLASVEKEGAISLLALNIQQKLNNLQTQIEIGLQSESAVARGVATAAQYALNLAMSLNPVVALILGLTAVISVMVLFATHAAKAAIAQAELNSVISDSVANVDAFAEGLKRGNEKIISELEKSGARQSSIQKQSLKEEIALQNARVDEITHLNEVIEKHRGSTNKATLELVSKAEETKFKLQQDNENSLAKIYTETNGIKRKLLEENLVDIQANIKKQLTLAAEGTKQQLQLQKAAVQAQANIDKQAAGQDIQKVIEIQASANKEKEILEIAFQKRLLEIRIKNTEAGLILIRDGTVEQYQLQTRLLSLQTKAELLNTKLSEKEKLAIHSEALQKQLLLDRNFNESQRRQALQAEIDRNKAVLDARQTDSQTALDLTIENIALAAQIEIDSTFNNAAKVKAIIADRDKQIREARKANVEKDLADEISLQQSITGVDVRAIANKEGRIKEAFDKNKLSARNYLAAYNKLVDRQSDHELSINRLKIDSLNKELKDGLISQTEYNLKYAALQDEQAKIVEDSEEKKRKAMKDTLEAQKQKNIVIAELIVQTASQVGQLLFDAEQQQLDIQQQHIDSRRKDIQKLKDDGKISEKESIQRLQQIDREERRLKRQQAIKDKELAIFNAVISTAQAVIKAFSTSGPIAGSVLAAIVGVIGAAQIALIASRPIPNFFSGKKDKFSGLARVGESGAELVEQSGQMRVVKKQEIVWLNPTDKVYTPAETSRMLQARPVMNKNTSGVGVSKPGYIIDYERLGREVGRNTHTSVYVDGILQQEIEHNKLIKYLDNRRRWD